MFRSATEIIIPKKSSSINTIFQWDESNRYSKSDCFTKYSRIMQLQGINIVKNLMKLFCFFLFFDLHDSPDSWEWPHLSGWLLAPVLCWWSLPCSLLQHLSRGYSTLLEEWSQHFDFPFESQLLYYEDDPTEVDLNDKINVSKNYWILFLNLKLKIAAFFTVLAASIDWKVSR